MPKVIKPSNPFTNVCAGFCLTTFSAPPQICTSTVFLLPNSRNEEMMGDGFRFGATAAGLFWAITTSVDTSCNKQGRFQRE